MWHDKDLGGFSLRAFIGNWLLLHWGGCFALEAFQRVAPVRVACL